MSKTVFIKQNSPEIRKKLEDAGYYVCACAKFKDSVWLVYHPDEHFYRDIHGVGGTDKTDGEEINKLSPEERIKVWLTWDDYFSKEREFFETVDDFLKAYPNPKRDQHG